MFATLETAAIPDNDGNFVIGKTSNSSLLDAYPEVRLTIQESIHQAEIS